MYLIFPPSMILPEIAARREDHHFEEWLTAALIENTNQERIDDDESCLPGITDLWMLEIAERNGKTLTGKFNVEFKMVAQGSPRAEQRTGVFFFSLNTDTGEMQFA